MLNQRQKDGCVLTTATLPSDYADILTAERAGLVNTASHYRRRIPPQGRIRHVKRETMKAVAKLVTGIVLSSSALFLGENNALAQRINNKVAVFSALDKVTARIRELKIPIDQTVQFGSLKVTPRVCYSSPPEVRPKTSTFVQVDEVLLNGDEKRIFSGWMFAESPALNAVEHPVFDVWLTRCDGQEKTVGTATNKGQQLGPATPPSLTTRRRVRR